MHAILVSMGTDGDVFPFVAFGAKLYSRGHRVTLVANELDYSSPQAFGRHLRAMLRLTALEFRERYDGEGMLQHFRDELILPHLPRLRRFDPLGLEVSTRAEVRARYEA